MVGLALGVGVPDPRWWWRRRWSHAVATVGAGVTAAPATGAGGRAARRRGGRDGAATVAVGRRADDDGARWPLSLGRHEHRLAPARRRSCLGQRRRGRGRRSRAPAVQHADGAAHLGLQGLGAAGRVGGGHRSLCGWGRSASV